MEQEPVKIKFEDYLTTHVKDRPIIVPLAEGEMKMLVKGMAEYYDRSLWKTRRKHARNKEDTKWLGEMQELLQYLIYVSKRCEEGKWPEESTSS
jgi:hypothetical protein